MQYTQGEKARAKSCPMVLQATSSQDSNSAPTPPGLAPHTFANDSVSVGDYPLVGNQHILDIRQECRVQVPELDGLFLEQWNMGPIPAVCKGCSVHLSCGILAIDGRGC